jgi:hypothetical protein
MTTIDDEWEDTVDRAMTDRAVQPEAPATEAGRRLLDQWNPGHVNPRLVQTVLAIEAEAYRQGWDANTATSFGNRAASQERPQPTEWLRGVQACIDHGHYLTIEDAGVAQERPQPGMNPAGMIDGTDFATDEELDASIRRGVAQERPPIDVARQACIDIMSMTVDHLDNGRLRIIHKTAQRGADPESRLAGGSVASPEEPS